MCAECGKSTDIGDWCSGDCFSKWQRRFVGAENPYVLSGAFQWRIGPIPPRGDT